jgi:hypothetical protein
MDQIQRCKKFKSNPTTDIENEGNVLMLWFDNQVVRPHKGVWLKKIAGEKKISAKEFNYALDEHGEPIRSGRFYFTPEMVAIKKWCEEKHLRFSIDIKPSGPFTDPIDPYVEIHGNINKEILADFPVPYGKAQIVKE